MYGYSIAERELIEGQKQRAASQAQMIAASSKSASVFQDSLREPQVTGGYCYTPPEYRIYRDTYGDLKYFLFGVCFWLAIALYIAAIVYLPRWF